MILGHRAPFCAHFHNVESDDLHGSELITRHLLELGHKRIAFLCGPASAPWALERLEGYRRALREAGWSGTTGCCSTPGRAWRKGKRPRCKFCTRPRRITAVQSASDLSAMGAANVFLNQGLHIPGDLSVAGFGNILMSAHYRVPLTTVRQPKLRLGVAAMEMMQQLLSGGQPEARRLPSEIILRASTGPPKPPARADRPRKAVRRRHDHRSPRRRCSH